MQPDAKRSHKNFAEKEAFKPGMKEFRGDRVLIVICINVRSITT